MLERSVIGTVILAALCTSAWSQKQVNCAVIAGPDTGSGLSALVLLLEVSLSQDERVRLIERGKIDEVLKEQQLTAAGLAERDSMMKAGRLLRADAFIFITPEGATPRDSAGTGERGPVDRSLPEQPAPQIGPPVPAGGNSQGPAGQLIRIRVVETAHGLRLWEGYEQLTQGDVEAVSTRIAGTLFNILPKVAAPPRAVVPIGIVDIHRVQLSEKYEPLARVLPGLLSARLGKEPRIIMLERESLGTLFGEKQLTEGPESAFWNSAVLIDGYLQPGAGKGLEMGLRLRKATGEELSSLRVPVDPNRLSGAVDEAATRALRAVSEGSLPGRWDPGQEADEFYRQGMLLFMHGRSQAARPCLEAAHALQPDNVAYTGALFSASLPLPKTLNQPAEPADASAPTALELAELASLLTRQVRDGYESGVLPTKDKQVGYGLGALRSYFEDSISVATEEIRLINRPSRRIWFETAEKALMDKTEQADDPVLNVRGRIHLAWACSDNPEKVMAAVKERLNKAILPPEMGGAFASNDLRCWCCEQELFMAARIRPHWLAQTNLSASAERFRTLWHAYVKELTESRDPIVKFFACAAQAVSIGYASKDENRDLTAAYCQRAVDVLLNELHSPNEPLNDSMKELVRKTMTDCLSASPELDAMEAVVLWERIYSPLIEAGDAHNLALWNAGWKTGPYGGREDRQRYSKLFTRIDEVYAKHDQDPQISRARAILKNQLRNVRVLAGNPAPSSGDYKPRVTMLLRRSDWPEEKCKPRIDPRFSSATEYIQLAIREDTLWIGSFFLRSSLPRPFSIGLISLDLSRRQLRSIWWIALPSPNLPTGLVVRSDRVYLAVPEIGIVVVPYSDVDVREIVWTPDALTEANGLPSRGVMSVADAGNRLWVAYGARPSSRGERESGLGLYDPADGTWERIFCSSEQDNPPFSAGWPYRLGWLTPTGDKLFFFVDWTRFFPGGTSVDGLCEMDVNTRELKYFGFGGIGEKGHVISDRRPWLFASSSSLLAFDPNMERARLICGEPWWLKQQPELSIKRMEFDRAGGVEESLNRKFTYGPSPFGYVDLSGAAIHKNRVWARLGESQLVIIPMSGATGDVITLDNNLLEGDEVVRFVSTPHGLVGIGNGTAGLIETDDSWFTRSERK